jgi:predicted nucleic acid-binding protein
MGSNRARERPLGSRLAARFGGLGLTGEIPELQPSPDPGVVAWLDRQPAESVWTTAVTVFEVCFGLEVLTKGRRRERLEAAFARALEEDFEGRVLPFDEAAAQAAGALASRRRRAGAVVDVAGSGLDAEPRGEPGSRMAPSAEKRQLPTSCSPSTGGRPA